VLGRKCIFGVFRTQRTCITPLRGANSAAPNTIAGFKEGGTGEEKRRIGGEWKGRRGTEGMRENSSLK